MSAKVPDVQVQLMAPDEVTAESTSVELLMATFASGPLNATVICPAGAKFTLDTYLPEIDSAVANPADRLLVGKRPVLDTKSHSAVFAESARTMPSLTWARIK